MKVLRNGSIYLPAYFEDANNDPVTGATAVKFHLRTTDDAAGATNLSMTAELGGGWYSYLYTDSQNKPIVYWASLSGYKNFPGGIVELSDVVFSGATKSYSSSTAEQAIVTFGFADFGWKVAFKNMKLDLSNLTKDTIISVREAIDGTNYRIIDSVRWNTSMEPGVVIGGFYTSRNISFYAQSIEAEGATRSIPYRYAYEIL